MRNLLFSYPRVIFDGTPRIARYSVGPGRNFALTTTFDF